jgi:hypothetical protein
MLLLPAIGGRCAADSCPSPADEIVTDLPDITNSSLVVPTGSLQGENGVDWTVRHGSNALDGTNTRLRLGIAHCTEFLIDVPNYFLAFDGSPASGVSDTVVSFKRQLPMPFDLSVSATAGVGFPTGSSRIGGRGYQPYIQFPWSHAIADGWGVEGMFTVTWFPGEAARNPTFEPTFAVEKEIGSSADVFAEYAGDYVHQQPLQLLDAGGAWRFTRTQQLDFHAGFGLNSSTVDHYFGIGYSLRFDGLFKSISPNSP